MRTIKFKCYVPSLKEMSEGFTWQEWVGTMAIQQQVPPDDAVWLQSSGLFDRKGVEIYEGDLVVYYYANKPPTKPRAVEWRTSRGYTGLNIALPEQHEIVGTIYDISGNEESGDDSTPQTPVENKETPSGAA